MRPEPVRILLDENVPYGVTAWLQRRRPASAVDHVHDLRFGSRSDEHLYRWAEENDAIIVTYDEDFADQRRFPLGGRCGVLRLKIEPTDEASTCEALERVAREFVWEALRESS